MVNARFHKFGCDSKHVSQEHIQSEPVRSFSRENKHHDGNDNEIQKQCKEFMIERGDIRAFGTYSLQNEGIGYRTVVVCLFGAIFSGAKLQPWNSKEKINYFYEGQRQPSK